MKFIVNAEYKMVIEAKDKYMAIKEMKKMLGEGKYIPFTFETQQLCLYENKICDNCKESHGNIQLCRLNGEGEYKNG